MESYPVSKSLQPLVHQPPGIAEIRNEGSTKQTNQLNNIPWTTHAHNGGYIRTKNLSDSKFLLLRCFAVTT